MFSNRVYSFITILVVYLIAFAGSLLIYPLLDFEYWKALFITDIVATVIVFIFSCIFRNASVYDPYWSVQPIIILWCYAIKCGCNLFGILLVFVVTFWGIRLTCNWAYTFKNLHWQDWRYSMLKEKTGKFYPVINFVGIHMVPTIVVFLCIIPAVIMIYNNVSFKIYSLPFLLLSFCAAIFQGIADFQMHSFKKKDGKGFIRVGLWKHSRHPNYLCEILMWWGVGLASYISMPNKLVLLCGALCNTCLFLFVSIPLAEGHQSRKPGFNEYKKQTRMLL